MTRHARRAKGFDDPEQTRDGVLHTGGHPRPPERKTGEVDGRPLPSYFIEHRIGQTVTVRMQPGYDHSYFFMASFIADHVAFHAARLKA